MSPSIIKIRLESLKKDKKKLNKDYQAVADKKRMTSNPVEQNNLQLQLDSIAKKIEEIDPQIKDLKDEAEESKNKKLQEILSKFTNESFLIVQQAYRVCSPKGWNHISTEKPEEILADVLKMRQGDSEYTRIEHFVAYLLVLIQNSSLVSLLRKWAEENIDEFEDLLNQEREKLQENTKNKNSYLLLVLEKSNQDSASNNSDCYRIQASYISDINYYKYNHENYICDGCDSLNLSEYENKTFTIDKIGDVLNDILNKNIEYNFDCYSNLTIEIFLPLNLLNHPVDCWEFKDGTEIEDLDLGFPDTQAIGQKYKVVVRSYERWRQLYQKKQYRYSWERKWKQLEKSACSAFSLGSEDTVNDLVDPRQEIIGLKVVKAPEKIGRGSIFAAIIKTGTPVALWLRNNPRNFDYCQSEVERILKKCSCVHDLPNTLKDERSNAKLNVETDIGNHISLLWENPYRLPPDINYSM
ncbi:hypothetical protein [Mastigocoleus sp. MO_188.B34]|uniref:VMAP-C domain-containing protein n=1 Tax=Mastigocoleus sp. MO_188.B34 TaxID=3036635 RepID=UPI00261F3B63|nr:hypothetical protein [Mastigocoleus sp. MO_188.B34]MDJ0695216.1 hypothetical protein [Mastigocoleus sp. MO_188.B34]